MSKDIEVTFYAVFCTEQGQEILDHLEKQFSERPIMVANGDGMSQALHMAKREGQNSMVRYIKNKIKQGKDA